MLVFPLISHHLYVTNSHTDLSGTNIPIESLHVSMPPSCFLLTAEQQCFTMQR